MILKLRLIRNIGHFNNVDAGKDLPLRRISLIYAENGRGKTTLAAILRSLSESDPLAILERRRIKDSGEPHVAIELEGDSSAVVFENDRWNAPAPRIEVFDDAFIENNIHSGLNVTAQQRQRLHDVIIGREAVQLQNILDEKIEAIETHNRQSADLEAKIKPYMPHGFSIQDFCALEPSRDIDSQIDLKQKAIRAANEEDQVKEYLGFDAINVPGYEISKIEELLRSTIDTIQDEAVRRIEAHLSSLGNSAEGWIADGMQFVGNEPLPEQVCPFCGSALDGSDLIHHYRGYFSQAYSDLKRNVRNLQSHLRDTFGAPLKASIENGLRQAMERQQFWSKYCKIEPIVVDTQEIFAHCEAATEGLLRLLHAKENAPLEAIEIPKDLHEAIAAFHSSIAPLIELNARLQEANHEIEAVKVSAGEANTNELMSELTTLKAIKARYDQDVDSLCNEWLAEREAKAATELERDRARSALNEHRNKAFPEYQNAVNDLLEKFGTDFRIADLRPTNLRSGSTTTYAASIGGGTIDLSGKAEDGTPSFRSTLSAGDRATMAFAFFVASLGQAESLNDTVLVIDDPVSASDTGRTLATAQEIRKLADRAQQVIVLSHNKSFLCAVARHTKVDELAALEIIRKGQGSTLVEWDVTDEVMTDHDRRHKELTQFLAGGGSPMLDIARDLRPHLEGYLRVTCPSVMAPGRSLGKWFLERCKDSIGSPEEIMAENRLRELADLTEYAAKFHHDSNPAWQSETITDTELRTYVSRTLKFTQP